MNTTTPIKDTLKNYLINTIGTHPNAATGALYVAIDDNTGEDIYIANSIYDVIIYTMAYIQTHYNEELEPTPATYKETIDKYQKQLTELLIEDRIQLIDDDKDLYISIFEL